MMKRSHTLDDLSSCSEVTEDKSKKSVMGELSDKILDKIPRFKIPKKNGKSPSKNKDETSNDATSSSPKRVDSRHLNPHVHLTDPPPEKSNAPEDSEQPKKQTDASLPSLKQDNATAARNHYNTLKQVPMNQRHESKIFNLRGFNNYVKSLTMNDFLRRLGPLGQKGATILDFACGKGGDLRKWGLAKPAHVVCVDIADVSIQQCQARYAERPTELTFKANFIVADCTRDDLDSSFNNQGISDVEFDLVSCQFALHYGFESQCQAKRMIRNAVSHLKPNCFFFGTIPNSNYLVKKYRTLPSDCSRFGNDVYYVDFLQPGRTQFPLFGSKYVFYLDGAVEELAEFLIHFPLLNAILEEEGLECVLAEPFTDYIYKVDQVNGERMLKDVSVLSKTRGLNNQGTLTPEEWEVVSCYMVFGFRKLTEDELDKRRNSKRRKLDDGE